MPNERVHFGPFELDTVAGELRQGNRRIRLQEKALKLLLALLQRPGEVVTRARLRANLWPPNVIVDFDNGLNNVVNKLRGVLGDSADAPKYIETVGRRGYRFIGQLTSVDPGPPAANVAPPSGTGAAIGATPHPASPETPEKRLAEAARMHSSRPPRARARAAIAAIAAAAIVGITATVVLAVRSSRDSAGPPRIASLAVLPLRNLSSDPEQEYFSDGMTDALISQLANIRSLRIISQQSVMRYKDSTAKMPAIARELGVDGVIEGTVLRTPDRVRVSVQLLHGPSDRHLWSEQYERPLDDVIALQAEIARNVARQVRAALTGPETDRLSRNERVDAEAYDLYLRGRYLSAQRTEEGLRRALDYFDRALAIEPDFARAHAAVAETYGPLTSMGFVSPEAGSPKMRDAALRALALDPDLVEGITTLAAYEAFHAYNPREGERLFLRALEVSANYPLTFMWYGLMLENEDRQAENLAARRRAIELDPLGIAAPAGAARAFYLNGLTDEAIELLQKTLELHPGNAQALSCLGLIYVAIGRNAEAIDAFKRAGDLGSLAHAYAVAGRRADALAVLAQLEKRARVRYVPAHAFALALVGLGDIAGALDALERGVALRDPALTGIKVDPRFAPLAQEPRFLTILEKMGLR